MEQIILFIDSLLPQQNDLALLQQNAQLDKLYSAIMETHTWWGKFLVPFAAALFGTGAAFILNSIKDYRKFQLEKNSSINEVILLFSINMMNLLNFKSQFLDLFADELHEFYEHAVGYHPKAPIEVLEGLAAVWEISLRPKIEDLLNTYKPGDQEYGLNGLLKRNWEKVQFGAIDPKKVYFIHDGMPEALRFLTSALQRIESFKDTVEERSILWKNGEPAFRDHIWDPVPDFMLPLFEMIEVRSTLRQYAEDALVLMHATCICLMDYQKRFFPKRGKVMKRIFGQNVHIHYKLPDAARASIPQPSINKGKEFIGDYSADWFKDHFGLIKKDWSKFFETA